MPLNARLAKGVLREEGGQTTHLIGGSLIKIIRVWARIIS
jgi:hypothetical protein